MSISIVNRGGVPSSSGGGPSGGLKPELTVAAPSGSKLEISTGGSGGSANGDGMALYNGVMLPDINTVWTDKETYPYAYIKAQDLADYGFDGAFLYEMWMVSHTSRHDENGVISFNVGDGESLRAKRSFYISDASLQSMAEQLLGSPVGCSENWGTVKELSAVTSDYIGIGVWTSYDILNDDGSVYLAASDPIPLDGMNVITWDGDTTGLESMSLGYKVSDEIVDKETAQNGIVVMSDNTISNTGMHFELSDDVFALEMGAVCIVYKDGVTIDGETIEHKGTYFLSAANYTKLFAYPASSGDKQIVDTYTLGENETEHTFTVDLGTYTVTGTLGEKSKSVDVVIDTVGQYSVEIDYKLWLYREGDECEDVTGGYSKVPIGSTTNTTAPTKESDRIAFTSGYYPNLCTNNAIDVTNYTRLFAEIQATGTNKWHPWVGIFTARNIGDNYRNALMAVGQDGDSTANKQVVSRDITSITGQKYIGAAITGDNATGYVYNIWLE